MFILAYTSENDYATKYLIIIYVIIYYIKHIVVKIYGFLLLKEKYNYIF